MSRFIESIKIENKKAHLLDLHQKRVDNTMKHFGVTGSLDVIAIIKKLDWDENGFFKLRLVYDLEKKHSTQLIPYALPEIRSFSLVEANQLDYSFKFEERQAFETLKIKAKSEHIIVVKNNHITDTAISNLIFLKEKVWYTPNSFLLNGVMRQHLLTTKKIKECPITLQNFQEFSHFKIINSMNSMEDSFLYSTAIINNLHQPNTDLDY
jgi:4-amino-4-deoxychorismate lyase